MRALTLLAVSSLTLVVTACASRRPAPTSPAAMAEVGSGCEPLQLVTDVVEGGFVGDLVRWSDAACRPREALLVYNDRPDPTGQSGGYLRRYTYEARDGRRTSSGASDRYPGFGWTLHHHGEGGKQTTRSISHEGTFSRERVGAHHLTYRYQWRYAIEGQPVRAVVEWRFATGHDHPRWSVTYDLTGAEPDQILADTRGPYGELVYDGDRGLEVTGAAWGDRFQFRTVAPSGERGPLQRSHGWRYDLENQVPYAYTWSDPADALMGLVATRPWSVQRAGGTGLHGSWGARSDGPLPENWRWPFQLNQYQLDATPSAHRVAWGFPFGSVGASKYLTLGEDLEATGYPHLSYSVYVVLGERARAPVRELLESVSALWSTELTCAEGTPRAAMPSGPDRDEAPAPVPGLNPSTGELELEWGEGIACTLDVAEGRLMNPIVRVGNLPDAPLDFRLDGRVLDEGEDVLVSRQSGELTFTLRRTLVGRHLLEVRPR